MKRFGFYWVLILFDLIVSSCASVIALQSPYEFTVLGAGSAGIAVIGVLLDQKIDPQSIMWIDDEFNVGRIGKYYTSVPGNTKVSRLINTLNACESFKFSLSPIRFRVQDIDQNTTCDLRYIVEPLQWITDHLKKTVHTEQGLVSAIERKNNYWVMRCNDVEITTKNLILATGSHPAKLFLQGPQEILLDDALVLEKLAQVVSSEDRVAVFGTSHSGVLVLKNLSQLGVRGIVSFYKQQIRYFIEALNINENTGLKGSVAVWAKNVLEAGLVPNLTAFVSDDENIERELPSCTKVVYAIGFERNAVPGFAPEVLANYNKKTGVIGDNLFGLGIAFPEEVINYYGESEFSIGIWQFIQYAKRVVPKWLKT